MAKPIKETPILKGEDAKRFKEQISKPRDRHAAIKEKERILKNYNRLKDAETFNRHIPA
jgi:hypothetical protein